MTKINHNRPTLRLLDNYRRELKAQQREYSVADDIPRGSVGKSRMPSLSQTAQARIIDMFDRASAYFRVFSNYLESISPAAGISLRKKRASLEEKLNEAKMGLTDSCVQIVLEALREKIDGQTGVIKWLDWLQKEAQRTNDHGLYDILEIGVKPAFEKVETAIAKSALR
ncbi:hypothetical protein [Rhizobium leguminosarum]|uniref:hypothetical protein n=1 Tax=Rhizobium leguminosarum TaxID=384 RepID=UPI00103C271A|nr:hypothetical protein [Rhizobium leguminosarum]TBZ06263.1 hypothetical protein E0H38_33165 [Rhizobium leguminosarum bv. viciae]